MNHPKKLIEVALPLEAINRESAREKSIRHGHPSTLHLWWARRPLAACRAVIFAQMVDDPSGHPERFPTEEDQSRERQRLFRLMEELVEWENINNEPLLERARAEIRKYAPGGQPPPLLDPFAGGGSIPLEAQRLGLEAHASDLNPVAVLINKALIEIPPKFAGQPPVNPTQRPVAGPRARPMGPDGQAQGPVPTRLIDTGDWRGAAGLAEDVRYYGQWMRDEAERRIGHLYPPAVDEAGKPRTVIAWLWARTVTCPNPACRAQMPLVRSFWLSKKKGKQAWVEPVVDRNTSPPKIRFTVRTGVGRPREGTVDRRGAICIACNTPVPFPYIRDEGKAGRMGAQLMAIVAEGDRGRIYLPPDEEQEAVAQSAQPPADVPDTDLPEQALGFRVQLYGMTKHRDLFTPRQLVALTTFSDLVGEAREQVYRDAVAAGLPDDRVPLHDGGRGATAYADAVATYLGLGVSRLSDILNALCRWEITRTQVRNLFSRQAVPMVWDFAENNVFAGAAGDYEVSLNSIVNVVQRHVISRLGRAIQSSVTELNFAVNPIVISTDPPYYDNIGYADLSDFFYIWLRRSLANVYPDLFSTLLVPKAQELVATPYRFDGDKQAAQEFFERGLLQAFARMREVAHPAYPLTVYYAFKQTETNGGEVASTGWETMLEGLVRTGFQITGTWPMRTELGNRPVASGTNALASSIVLVCRVRPQGAPMITRRDFIRTLQQELPRALRDLQRGNIAPVDLAQAAIGPGMAVFSRYRRVVEADGSAMNVRTALALINQVLDEFLAEQEGEFDPDTRWAVAWFEQYAFEEGPYGDAETLSKAKNTSVQGMVEAGILYARAGKVRLLRRDELPSDWDPARDRRVTVWEVTHHLIRTLEEKGEVAAAELLARVGPLGDPARDLAYRLYTICERKGWAQEALPYNALVASWSDVGRLAGQAQPEQGRLL